MSQYGPELAGEASRASMSGSHYNDGSVRSNASSTGSSKRRSRILMKIIPFARDTTAVPSRSAAAESSPRFGTFPRVRAKDTEERVETLASRFSDLTTASLTPPLSACSFTSTFSAMQSTATASTPATSPEMSLPDLPAGRRSGSQPRRPRIKSTHSRESVRSLFSSASNQSLQSKAAESQPANETEWEKMLEDAADRASWQSSINHRPRAHQTPGSSRLSSSHGRTASVQQSTWPRISQPLLQHNSLLLEHVFVDASDDGTSSQYAASVYSAFPSGEDGDRSLPMSAASSQQGYGGSGELPPSRPPRDASGEQQQKEAGQGRFGTLPRVKSRRPSTTGSSMRGEPAQFELRAASQRGAPAAVGAMLGTASLGRATTLRRRPIPDAASIWQMGRRRSSGIGSLAGHGGSFSAGGATRMLPTIPQGHSRETSLADTTTTEADNAMPWLGIDPYAQGPTDPFPRGYSISHRHDSFASDAGGPGEYLPFRFFYTRRESQDDMALLDRARVQPTLDDAAPPPVFDPNPFQRAPASRRPSLSRSNSSHELYRRTEQPDVPEAVEDEEWDPDGDGWCRRRSTFASLATAPHAAQVVVAVQ